RLHRNGNDPAVCVRIEAGIKRTIRIEPADAAARLSVEVRKVATGQNLSVSLQGDGNNTTIGVGIKPVISRLSARHLWPQRQQSQKRNRHQQTISSAVA